MKTERELMGNFYNANVVSGWCLKGLDSFDISDFMNGNEWIKIHSSNGTFLYAHDMGYLMKVRKLDVDVQWVLNHPELRIIRLDNDGYYEVAPGFYKKHKNNGGKYSKHENWIDWIIKD